MKSVAVTADGRCAVSASVEGTLKVWDLASGECLRTLEGHTKSVNGVALTRRAADLQRTAGELERAAARWRLGELR